MPNNVNDELYHYGVKGMKWGVRRAKTSNQPSVIYAKVKDISPEILDRGKRAVDSLPIDIQQFASKKGPRVPARKMPRDISLLMEYATSEERSSSMYVKSMNGHIYTVMNHPDGTPRILHKRKLTGTIHDRRGDKK